MEAAIASHLDAPALSKAATMRTCPRFSAQESGVAHGLKRKTLDACVARGCEYLRVTARGLLFAAFLVLLVAPTYLHDLDEKKLPFFDFILH